MVRCDLAHRTMALALASLFLLLSGVRGACAEKRPVSRQELNSNLERAKVEMQDAERRLRELAERSRQIEEELKSPDRKRPIAEIRKEEDAIAEEWAKQTKRDNDAARLYDNSLIDAAKSSSVLIAGTANACGVSERLYPEFLGTLEPKQASSFPPQIRYEPEGSDIGLKKLLTGETEAVAIDRPLSKEEKAALEKAFPDPQRQPQEIVFCRAAVVVVVCRGNRVRSLTIDQVEQIYQAKIDKWSAIGGVDQSIGRLGTKYPLLSWWIFTNRILHGEAIRFPDEFKFDPNHLPQVEELNKFYKEQQSRFRGGGPFPCYESDATLIEAVSKKFNGIGYCILFPSSELMKSVRLVPIARNKGEDPEPPLRDGALSETYPLQDRIWFLVHPDAPESTKAFVAFACSPKAAKIVQQCGLWPECRLDDVHRQQRLAEVKAGNGTEIAVCDLTGAGEVLKHLSLEYAKAKAAVRLTFVGKGKAEEVREKLKEGTIELLLTDVGIVAKGDEAEEPQAMELGRMAVGIIVHPENSLRELTLEDVKAYFSGEIKK